MTAFLVFSLAVAGPCDQRRELPQAVRGIVLPLHDADPSRSYRREIEEIRALGATAVSIMPTWSMADIHSPEVVPGNSTISQLEETLGLARAAGLAVLVAPVLQVRRLEEGEWRGVLAPPDWDRWFASYRRLLVETARIAERHGAHSFLVASELCSTEHMRSRWLALIGEVRTVFCGSIAYQANWDHRDEPTFLDFVDLRATNAYFELVDEGESATVEELVEAWRPFRDELVAWAVAGRRPLLITEVGYPSVRGAAAHPWDYTRDAPVDLAEQRRAYEAFLRTWMAEERAAQDAVLGFFLYEWWGEGGTEDRGYTPRGKPAEDLVRRHFAVP